MQCPKCNNNMWHVELNGVDVDRCSGCQGIFFDMNEEMKLAAMKGSEAIDTGDKEKGSANNAIRKILCPRDGQPMIPMVSLNGRVHYESCKTCFGAYFDAGELTEFKKSNSFLDFFT